MPKNWKLVRYEPTSFAGISKENANNSIIVFLDNKNIIGLHGDQATCKTSNMAALQALLGGLMPANALNSLDNNTKASMQIALDDGRTLDITIDKNNFRLYVTQEMAGKIARTAVNSPKDFIRGLIGPLGVSPMFLKSMDGDKQVAWLREIADLSEEQLKVESEIHSNYKTDFKARTDLNREAKRLKAELDGSFFFDWDSSQKTFHHNRSYESVIKDFEKGAGDGEAIRQRWEAANADCNKLTTYKTTREELLEQKKRAESDIEQKKKELSRLQLEITEKQEAVEKLEARIQQGSEMIQKLDGAEKRAKDAQDAMMNLSKFMQQKHTADADAERLSKYNKLTEQSTVLTAKLDKWIGAKKGFVQAIAPDVEGLEVRVASDMDVEFEMEAYKALNPDATDKDAKAHVLGLEVKNKTGIFYRGSSVAELCESELWDLCLIMWQHMSVNVVFIENLNALGTDAVKQINKFAEKGIVFYSQMERGQTDLEIVFTDELDIVPKAKTGKLFGIGKTAK